ncbi:uncharacterized protein METZ01_LOCUS290816, partial [marine metagenome]
MVGSFAWFRFSLIALALVFIACGSDKKETPVPESASSLESIAAAPQLTVSVHQGAVNHQTAGASDWTRAVEGMVLEVHDHVKTLAFSTAVVHFADGSRVKLHPNTELAVDVFTLRNGGPPDGHRIS